MLGLFLEMLLIRWIGTEVRIFAYLQNTILVACLLGLGLGCFTVARLSFSDRARSSDPFARTYGDSPNQIGFRNN